MAKQTHAHYPSSPEELHEDPRYQAMPWAAKGVLRHLLDCQWAQGPLPADPFELGAVTGIEVTVLDGYAEYWTPWFPRTREGLRVANPELEARRRQLERARKSTSAKKRAAVKARWEKEITFTCMEPVPRKTVKHVKTQPVVEKEDPYTCIEPVTDKEVAACSESTGVEPQVVAAPNHQEDKELTYTCIEPADDKEIAAVQAEPVETKEIPYTRIEKHVEKELTACSSIDMGSGPGSPDPSITQVITLKSKISSKISSNNLVLFGRGGLGEKPFFDLFGKALPEGKEVKTSKKIPDYFWKAAQRVVDSYNQAMGTRRRVTMALAETVQKNLALDPEWVDKYELAMPKVPDIDDSQWPGGKVRFEWTLRMKNFAREHDPVVEKILAGVYKVKREGVSGAANPPENLTLEEVVALRRHEERSA